MVGSNAPFQEGHGFLAGAGYGNRETAFAQGILNKCLDCVVILDDKDCWYFRQGFPTSPFNCVTKCTQAKGSPTRWEKFAK